MAKTIHVPRDEVDIIIEAPRAQLLGARCCGGAVEVKQTFKKDDRCANLYFSPTAWVKMSSLVSGFHTEVQWHGLVRRISECEFEVYDILVPPHTVSATTVISDQEEYSEWLNELDDDTFGAMRFHGHSHVNMGVTPSGVDTDYRSDLITQLPKPSDDEDVFYIFLIINKSHQWSAEIYDVTNNALYSSVDKEIDLAVMFEDGSFLDVFVREAKKVAVAAPVTTTPAGYYAGGAYHSVNQTPSAGQGGKKKVNDVTSDNYGDYDYYGRYYAKDAGGYD